MSDEWFEKIVSDFITNNRVAPLPVDFLKVADEERKKYHVTRMPTEDEIHPSENSVFTKDEIAEFFSVAKAVVRNGVPREQVDQYATMVKRMLVERKSKICWKCNDSGVVMAEVKNTSYVYKCGFCEFGKSRPENWPTLMPGNVRKPLAIAPPKE